MQVPLLACISILSAGHSFAQSTVATADIRLDSDQAEAALAVATGRRAWQHLASTDGYIRLKKREAEMGRPFEDDDFRSFLSSDGLRKQSTAMSAALDQWKRADFRAIASRVRSYLPTDAKLRATVYIVVKPRTNSFVYELTTNPAIFLYLDPAIKREEFENTVAHELHHVGLASLATNLPARGASELSGREWARRLVSAFGVGLAMLAAAGGADVHPHKHSSAEIRAQWDRDLLNVPRDLRSVEEFLLDTVAGKLDEGQQREKAMSFFGTQGPWYTLGWAMAVAVEKAKGRAALIECMKDMPKLLLLYNQAVDDSKPKWSNQLLDALSIR
jgi:hypothetical protein